LSLDRDVAHPIRKGHAHGRDGLRVSRVSRMQ